MGSSLHAAWGPAGSVSTTFPHPPSLSSSAPEFRKCHLKLSSASCAEALVPRTSPVAPWHTEPMACHTLTPGATSALCEPACPFSAKAPWLHSVTRLRFGSDPSLCLCFQAALVPCCSTPKHPAPASPSWGQHWSQQPGENPVRGWGVPQPPVMGQAGAETWSDCNSWHWLWCFLLTYCSHSEQWATCLLNVTWPGMQQD